MSRLLISTSRPPAPSDASDAATMPAEVSEFSTSPQPAPPVASAAAETNLVPRELAVAATPSLRSSARFCAPPAVPKVRTPEPRLTSTAARPTPPAAPCTSSARAVP